MDQALASAESGGRALSAQETAPLVLVVDDDGDLRRLFVHALTRAGFRARECRGGREALAALHEEDVALVLLDSRMPEMDGTAVLRSMRADPATRAVPVVMVTGDGEIDERVAGLDAGADDYVVKPIAISELVARVRAHLRGRTLWSAAVIARDLRRRAQVAGAIGKLAAETSPERLPELLCEEYRRSLGAGLVAILLSAQGRALAVADHDGPADPSSWALGATGLAGYLRRKARTGPWIQRLPQRSADSTLSRELRRLGLEGAACVPIPVWRRHGEPQPLLIVTPAADEQGGDMADEARRLATVIDLASVAAGVLGPYLLESDDVQQQRDVLRSMIAAGAFTTHFQPITTIEGAGTVGYEALTRFLDGAAPQRRFAQAAALGLSAELEHATLRSAVTLSRNLPDDAWVSLNVSPGSVTDRGLLAGVARDAERPVVLEVTEQDAIDDYEAVLDAVGAAGPDIRLAVDDAGAGHASLRHILRLQPTYVKLDMTLVRDIDRDPSREAMVAGLVHFGEATGSMLIAEGVERAEEADALRGLRVPLAQGYLFGRPAPVAA